MSKLRVSTGVSAAVLASVLLAACGSPKSKTDQSKVLATVDGSEITQQDVQRTAVQFLGVDRAANLDRQTRKKLLDGLVLSRALAMRAESEMDADQKAVVAAQVAAYRERLLVKRYLKAHANPMPVTDDMVEAYYRKHPERFGGGSRRHYQMLLTTRALTSDERQQIVSAFNRAIARKDWPAYVKGLKGQGLPVALHSGESAKLLPEGDLRTTLDNLAEGETSDVVMQSGRPYLLRLTQLEKREPKPLAAVREQIRKALEPVRVKQAIDKAKQQVMKTAKITYSDSESTQD